MAEEEVVDQKRCLEDSCKSKCTKPYVDYQQCVKRVEGDNSGQKHCTGQYFDYWSCIDKCVDNAIGYAETLSGVEMIVDSLLDGAPSVVNPR